MINRSYFIKTGNPFVDGGIYAIQAFYKKNYGELTPEFLREKVEDLIDLYLKGAWKKQLHSVFTINCTYLSHSHKTDEKRKGVSLKFLEKLLDDFKFPSESGSCIACGRRDAVPDKTREKIPLTGSGKLMNYFSGYSSGENYCSVCTFAVQFLPLFLYSLGKYFLLFYCLSDKLMRIWADECIKNVNEQMSSGNYTGCLQHGYRRGDNALFYIIEKIIRDRQDLVPEDNPSICAYIFSNYTQNPPPLSIIHLPNSVFRFLIYVSQLDFASWKKITNRGYKKLKTEDERKWRENRVYRALLNNESIVEFFISKKGRRSFGTWDVLSYYLKEVRGMDNKRIEVIKKVADKIAEYIEKTDDTKKLFALETCKSFGHFCNILLKITKYEVKTEGQTIFTLDEYLNDLFPEGALGWKETRDIILFRIYEKLASFLKEKRTLESEELEDEMEEV